MSLGCHLMGSVHHTICVGVLSPRGYKLIIVLTVLKIKDYEWLLNSVVILNSVDTYLF